MIGIDVSRRAILRPQRRVPEAQFEVTTLEDSLLVRRGAPFDLVVAADVLYYMTDIRACLTQMEQVGGACFVTYYNKCGGELDATLVNHGVQMWDEFEFEDTRWTARWSVKSDLEEQV